MENDGTFVPEGLLATYEAERIPVAEQLLRTTDRAFMLVVKDTWLAGLLSDATSEPVVHAYFTGVVHVTDEVYGHIRDRVIDLAKRFTELDARGDLVLDLDLTPRIAAAPPLPPDAKKAKKHDESFASTGP